MKEEPSWYEPSFEFDDLEYFADMMQCYSQPPPPSRHFQVSTYINLSFSNIYNLHFKQVHDCTFLNLTFVYLVTTY